MNLLLQLLIAAALIVAMVGLRVFASRRAIRQRLQCNSGSDECNDAECSHHCGEHDIGAQPGSRPSE